MGENASNGVKVLGGIAVSVALVVAVMAALWLPLANRQSDLKTDFKDHEQPPSHARVQGERIDALAERLAKLEAAREKWIDRVPGLDATQDGRLDNLERLVYGNGGRQ